MAEMLGSYLELLEGEIYNAQKSLTGYGAINEQITVLRSLGTIPESAANVFRKKITYLESLKP